MIFFCEECGSKHDIDLEKIAEEKQCFCCQNCDEIITVSASEKQLINPVFDDLLNDASQGETPHRVLIVDDSKLIRQAFCLIFESTDRIQVVGEAANGEEALEKINELEPDLILLDVNMPVMDGETTLKQIMIKTPCPVVVTSNLGQESQKKVIDFLCLGAVDFAGKPVNHKDKSIQQQKIIERVCQAARARIDNFKRVKPLKTISKEDISAAAHQTPSEQLIVINTGAGGYAELLKVIPLLPEDLKACIVSLQTTPPDFMTASAEYFDRRSPLKVLPLQNDAPLVEGLCYIGTNGLPLALNVHNGKYSLGTDQQTGSPEKCLKSFDVFLASIADAFSGRTLVVLLSGADIGDLEGLRRIKEKSGQIIVEEPDSCMVPFSLERVIHAKLADLEISPFDIASHIIEFTSPNSSTH